MRFLSILVAAVFAIVCAPLAVSAHKLNQSYVYFQVKEDSLSGRFEVILEDADKIVPMDSNGDGKVTREEFLAKAPQLFDSLAGALTLKNGGETLSISSTGFDTLGQGATIENKLFGQLSFDIQELSEIPEAIEVDYVYLFDDIDPTHSGYAIIEENYRTGVADNEAFISLIFGPGTGAQELSLMGQSWFTVLYDFVIHGVWHIWIGYDHILFLVSLLISSVMVLKAGQWMPRETFGSAFWSVLKIITLFTLAHSVTLSLAALGLVRIPAPFIEFVIAISIAVMALDNIFPVFHKRAWIILFGFGLIHGFGFANVLAPLGVDPQHTVVTLAAFNIGVEIGQAVIVAILFPILYMLRKTAFYKPVIMKIGSLILIAIALYWAVERSPELIEGLGRIMERGTLTPNRG